MRSLPFLSTLTTFVLCHGLAQAQPVEAPNGRLPMTPVTRPARPGNLIQPRYAMSAVVVGKNIYVIEGLSAEGPRSDIECLDTTKTPPIVSLIPTQLTKRFFHSAEASGPYIYVFGGNTMEGVTAEMQRFDTRDNSVKTMAPLPLALRAVASAVIGDKIYVAGGGDMQAVRHRHLYIYDIPTDTWKEGAPMPESKESEIVPWQGGLLAIGGYLGPEAKKETGKDTSTSVDFYDIQTDKWTALPPLPKITSAHHALTVNDAPGQEQVILFGDYVEPGRVLSGNPMKGDWRVVDWIKFVPRRHNAVASVDGDVYVIGGSLNDQGSVLDEVQRFPRKTITDIPRIF